MLEVCITRNNTTAIIDNYACVKFSIWITDLKGYSNLQNMIGPIILEIVMFYSK